MYTARTKVGRLKSGVSSQELDQKNIDKKVFAMS